MEKEGRKEARSFEESPLAVCMTPASVEEDRVRRRRTLLLLLNLHSCIREGRADVPKRVPIFDLPHHPIRLRKASLNSSGSARNVGHFTLVRNLFVILQMCA